MQNPEPIRGYVVDHETLVQFEIDDDPSLGAVAEMIQRHGYEPVWKDWDPVLQGNEGEIIPSVYRQQ